MPLARTKEETGRTVRLVPLGEGGLDLFTHSTQLTPFHLRRSENVELADGTITRRDGFLKLVRLTDPGGSLVYGTGKYGAIPAAAQLQLPAGGFAFRVSFTAVRPSAGNTAFILASRVNAQSYHVMSLTLSDAGVLTASWTKASDSSSVSIASSAIQASAATDVLTIFDAVSGTFTLYVNGASSGTPVTGIATTEKPIAGAGTAWHLGNHYNPAVPGLVANTFFDGKVHAPTLFTLRGLRPASGTTSLVTALRRYSSVVWPNPEMDAVVFHYDMVGGTLTDRSRFKNTGTNNGSPTTDTAVAKSLYPGNYVGHFTTPTGKRTNLVAAGGRLYYEVVRGGA